MDNEWISPSLTLVGMVDANKSGYIPYFDYIMDHDMLADRGIMIADNGMCIIEIKGDSAIHVL